VLRSPQRWHLRCAGAAYRTGAAHGLLRESGAQRRSHAHKAGHRVSDIRPNPPEPLEYDGIEYAALPVNVHRIHYRVVQQRNWSSAILPITSASAYCAFAQPFSISATGAMALLPSWCTSRPDPTLGASSAPSRLPLAFRAPNEPIPRAASSPVPSRSQRGQLGSSSGAADG
jgi:hypothetical protein